MKSGPNDFRPKTLLLPKEEATEILTKIHSPIALAVRQTNPFPFLKEIRVLLSSPEGIVAVG